MSQPNFAPVANPVVHQHPFASMIAKVQQTKQAQQEARKSRENFRGRGRGGLGRGRRDDVKHYAPPVLKTPEDVANYLQERRKNWPTRASIDAKRALEAEQAAAAAAAAPEPDVPAAKRAKTIPSEQPCKYFARGRCTAKKCPFAHVVKIPQRPATIREQLQQQDTMREKFAVLQCFRYFVEHKFFA
eukprot:TRINITY_DN4713_c0_g1_i1.p2 TRINITY_DN4713_c0_g1~~TRINITY_DN4713_c0_g1_i1.p2  ORF type:complete len:187 (+),score=45.92 TRINITY_DN4713_c0_g1_i1:46-606(+)